MLNLHNLNPNNNNNNNSINSKTICQHHISRLILSNPEQNEKKM